jgi:hypothetical protein
MNHKNSEVSLLEEIQFDLFESQNSHAIPPVPNEALSAAVGSSFSSTKPEWSQ